MSNSAIHGETDDEFQANIRDLQALWRLVKRGYFDPVDVLERIKTQLTVMLDATETRIKLYSEDR